MADVLSQSQIDALLKSMQDGPPKEEKVEEKAAEVLEPKKEEVQKKRIANTTSTVRESSPKIKFDY